MAGDHAGARGTLPAPWLLTASWLVLAGLYLVFAGSLSLTEGGAAVAAAAAATAFGVRQAQGGRAIRLRAPAAGALGRGVAAVLPDTLRVGRALLAVVAGGNRCPGSVARQGFRFGDRQADEAGRRAVVTLGISLAPNGYVLDLPCGGAAMLVHRLVAAPARQDTEWPV